MNSSATFKTEEDVIKRAIKNKEPSVARDFTIAKTFLKQQSDGGDNLYDHLSSILCKVIDERPANVMDNFEQFSRIVRQEKNRTPNTLLAGTYVEPENLKLAKTLCDCFTKTLNFATEGKEISERVTDFMHLQFYWSLAGYGCPQGHLFPLSCSIGILENQPSIRKCRYWGRIYGLKLNYYIVEADLTEDGLKKRNSNYDQDPSESNMNCKTYFVCNCLGDEWIALPNVSSKQIEMSEKIRKFFTGDLNATVRSNPEFPGSEKNLLRAVIQRITTETYAAPVGFYKVDEENGSTSIDSNYTPTESAKLADLSMWSQYRMKNTPSCSGNPSDSMPVWTIRRVQEHFPNTAMVVMRSNIWSGAISFCSQYQHDSLYFGWGVKYSSKAFIPPLPLSTSQEYNFNAKAANAEIPGAFVIKEAGNA